MNAASPSAENSPTPAAPDAFDPWRHLQRNTTARIALGRAGGSLRTSAVLDFRLAHARARDAVQQSFSAAALTEELSGLGLPAVVLATAAPDRRTFLLRPDLGRELAPESRDRIEAARGEWGVRDLAILVSDGLSALAAQRQIAPLLAHLVPQLREAGWTFFPVFVVPFARVKLQDEVGERLGARHALMLLGERPGLGAPDSLGAYFTHRPRAACSDADRNCVSNIRPEGFPPAAAARKLAYLLNESARRGLSGVALKDTGGELTPVPVVPAPPSAAA